MTSIIRAPGLDEMPALHRIWTEAFGGEDIASFFSHYFDPEFCAVAAVGGAPVAAGYLFPTGGLICGGIVIPCAMIYGVATLPGYRSLGYGAAVLRELLLTARRAGFPAVALCPSEDSLFEYYSARTELRDWFYIVERSFEKPRSGGARVELAPAGAEEYGRLREAALLGVAHIRQDPRALSYQSLLCGEYGGGLYSAAISGLDSRGADQGGGCAVACAAVEIGQGGEVWVKELLAPPGMDDAVLSAIADAYPAGRYIVRTPAIGAPARPDAPAAGQDASNRRTCERGAGARIRRFGMLSAPPGVLSAADPCNATPWLGFAFD